MARVFRYTYGFNFLEVLLVLVIIGIMFAYGWPAYTQYMIKTRRIEAATDLSKLALALEKYQMENNSYQGATLANLNFPEIIANDRYHLIIQYATNQDYLIIANPRGKQAEDDVKCGALTLNASGMKGITGSGNATDCW